jgi:hypothetical protein
MTTVAELIQALSEFDSDARVRTYNSHCGCSDHMPLYVSQDDDNVHTVWING